MIARGRVQNGVVVLDAGVRLPEGREVTVSVPTADISESPATYLVSEERRQALLGLIGAWKVENPPNDEEVKEIIHLERMRKYG